MSESVSGVSFDDLADADLVVEQHYFGGRSGNASDDALARLLPVGNQGGFRVAGSPRRHNVRLAVLFSTGCNPDWPDALDEQTGIFTYYGDNRTPGHDLRTIPCSPNRQRSSEALKPSSRPTPRERRSSARSTTGSPADRMTSRPAPSSSGA